MVLIPSTVIVLVALAQPLHAQSPLVHTPIVDLGYARYQGFYNTTSKVSQFRGIRYAAPPTGSQRWQAPQPPAQTSELQIADNHPLFCLQTTVFPSSNTNPYRNIVNGLPQPANPEVKRPVYDPSRESEDCLFLNVYYPGRVPPIVPLPVIVWIHGGALNNGGISKFNGATLVEDSGLATIVVTIQYRLGIYGFLSSQKIKDGGVLNAGLLDQQFAFQWVRNNIRKFGGNPSMVTIWGESAGAESVLLHAIANGGNTNPPLFRGAMISSVPILSQYPYNHAIPEAAYNSVVHQLGCQSSTDTLACLRAADIPSLQSANNNLTESCFRGTYIALPVTDGTFLTQRPSEAFKKGQVNKVKMLAFANANETQFADPFMDPGSLAKETFPLFGDAEAAEVSQLYSGLGDTTRTIGILVSELTFVCPTLKVMTAFKSHKGVFAIPPASHSLDLGYYFRGYRAITYHNVQFQRAFTHAFTNFAMTLDPNFPLRLTGITPWWNPYDLGKTEMVFNKTEDGRPSIKTIQTHSALLRRCQFWNSDRILALTVQ
ncbi:hypothetical protein HGRIS_014794 [Hohenbuehelia grisea]|uniref:Carboxylic ester hydrolase n=1 Tax=Hohenbuehelia grisea TaxID=104357 RepID=A0ABR3IQU2_9AGAR